MVWKRSLITYGHTQMFTKHVVGYHTISVKPILTHTLYLRVVRNPTLASGISNCTSPTKVVDSCFPRLQVRNPHYFQLFARPDPLSLVLSAVYYLQWRTLPVSLFFVSLGSSLVHPSRLFDDLSSCSCFCLQKDTPGKTFALGLSGRSPCRTPSLHPPWDYGWVPFFTASLSVSIFCDRAMIYWNVHILACKVTLFVFINYPRFQCGSAWTSAELWWDQSTLWHTWATGLFSFYNT